MLFWVKENSPPPTLLVIAWPDASVAVMSQSLGIHDPPPHSWLASVVARTSLVAGNRDLTQYATERAVEAADTPALVLSARLYRAAFAIAGDDYRAAASELHSLKRVPLQPADREILRAAISVAQELRRWPFDRAGEAPVSAAKAAPVAADAQGGPAAPSPAIAAAQDLLDTTGSLVGDTK